MVGGRGIYGFGRVGGGERLQKRPWEREERNTVAEKKKQTQRLPMVVDKSRRNINVLFTENALLMSGQHFWVGA